MRFNQLTIVGRLVRDAELKYLPNGNPLLKMRLAYDQGTKEAQSTGFVDVTMFGKRADAINKWCTKGRQILVAGRLEYREWDDADGKKRSAHELVAFDLEFTDPKREDAPAEGGATLPAPGQSGALGW